MGDFFTVELKALDEAIEKEESFSGVSRAKKSPKRQEQKETSSDSDNDLRDNKNISLKDLTLIILANMNSIKPIKPKRNEKIYALIHRKGHVNPHLLDVPGLVDQAEPKNFPMKKMKPEDKSPVSDEVEPLLGMNSNLNSIT